MLKEFKEFAMKGNVIDLAVGVVIGGAFGKIVTSFVEDIVLPLVSLLTGKLDFTQMFINLSGNPAVTTLAEAKKLGAATLNYGSFISITINFVIVAFSVFFAVKAINKMKKAEVAAPAEAPAPARSEVLLEEIRDALRK